MANELQLIRVQTEPTIVLDDIQSIDTEEGTAEAIGKPTSPVAMSKQYGAVIPLIQILNFAFDGETIVSFNINSTDNIPTATFTVLIRDKSFYSTSFPKDGDIFSIFIRSKDDLFKPIRNDYEITSINIIPEQGENTTETMTVFGKMRIPGYDAIKCFSVKDTSLKAVMKVATDLKLGFATNEVDTQDSQPWICPYDKVKDFLEDTVTAAYKDEDSFYTWFIDWYYYLNFVNVEPLFSAQPEIDEGMLISLLGNDYGKDSTLPKNQSKVVLTNWEEVQMSPGFIIKFNLNNKSASINLKHGYKRYVQYYDALIKENTSVFVDPKTSPGAELDKQLLKGRPLENFYLQQNEGKWMGVQYGNDGENLHGNYNYAKILNFQNNVHLDKMGMTVELQGLNFNLRRMHVVPVIIVIKRDTTRKIINEPIDESQEASNPNSDEPNRTKPILDFENTPIAIDKVASGFYVIKTMQIAYSKGQFKHILTMVRREWPTPPQTH
jgi:hypothetical protein